MSARAPARSSLLILGDRDGLAWVLRNGRMAFTTGRVADGAELRVGDRLFLYTTRGAFNNPTRDRGRVIGEAEVIGPLRRRRKAVMIKGREFTHECAITLKSLAPFRKGVDLAALVPRLEAFPDPSSWSARMRRPLLSLPERDAALLAAELAEVAQPPSATLPGYLAQNAPTV